MGLPAGYKLYSPSEFETFFNSEYIKLINVEDYEDYKDVSDLANLFFEINGNKSYRILKDNIKTFLDGRYAKTMYCDDYDEYFSDLNNFRDKYNSVKKLVDEDIILNRFKGFFDNNEDVNTIIKLLEHVYENQKFICNDEKKDKFISAYEKFFDENTDRDQIMNNDHFGSRLFKFMSKGNKLRLFLGDKTQPSISDELSIEENEVKLTHEKNEKKNTEYEFLNILANSKNNRLKNSIEDEITMIENSIEEEFLNKDFIKTYTNNKKSNYYPYRILNALDFYLEQLEHELTIRFLDEFSQILAKKMQANGMLSYNDFLIYFVDLLKNDAENTGKIRNYINKKYKYFLIDEFQDTSPLQSQMFFYLAAEKIEDKDWKNFPLRDGAIFLVGDPKQSIYRFRNADLESYNQIRKIFEDQDGNKELVFLTKNFRSNNSLKKYFNEVSKEIYAQDSKDENDTMKIDYKDIDNTDDIKEYYDQESNMLDGVLVIKEEYYEIEGDKSKNNKNLSFEYIARLINTLVKNKKYMLKDFKEIDKESHEKEAYSRQIELKDFMIITPKKEEVAQLANVLKEFNIPYNIEGKLDFRSSDIIKAIYSVLLLIKNSSERKNIYQAIKYLKLNVDDKYIFALKQKVEAEKQGKYLKLFNLGEFDYSKDYELAIEKLNSTIKEFSQYSTMTNFIKHIVDEFALLKKYEDDNLSYYYTLLESVSQKEADGNILTLEDLIQYFEIELFNNINENERNLILNQVDDRVRLANLHKIKGLEAPLVILLNDSFRNKGSNQKITSNTYDYEKYILKLGKSNVAQFEEIYKDEETYIKNERRNLEYVAMTRAKNLLIIEEKKKGQKYFDKIISENPNYLSDFIEIHENKEDKSLASCEKVEVIDLDKIKEENRNFIKVITPSREERIKISIQTKEEADLVEFDLEIENFDEENQATNNKKRNAHIWGTMIHELMEKLIHVVKNDKNYKDNFNKEELVDYLYNKYKNFNFASEGDVKKELNKKIKKLFAGGFDQKYTQNQDILDIVQKADEVYTEVPFSYMTQDGSSIVHGIMDLVYISKGQYHIIDFKTNKQTIDLDDEYAKQLNLYKNAISNIFDISEEIIHTSIYSIPVE